MQKKPSKKEGSEKEMRQTYRCRVCGVEGSVKVSETEWITTVIEKMRVDHKKKSPDCDAPVTLMKAVDIVKEPVTIT